MEILPVDLLIEIISSIFLYRYHVIKEYTILPTLPPPLNVFGRSMYDAKQFYRKKRMIFDLLIN